MGYILTTYSGIFLMCRKLRLLDITYFQVQFCISVLGMLLTFMIGIDRTEIEGICTFMSSLLQYFVLSSMLWMAAQALLMFRKLVLVFGIISKRFLLITSLICWSKLTNEIPEARVIKQRRL